MTSFADFCASDALGQLSKVRDLRRKLDQDYRPATDFWSRFREGVEAIHSRGGTRDDLAHIVTVAKDNRGGPYASAVEGYRKFWGRKTIELVGTLTPSLWSHDRLQVRVNPEFLVRIDGTLMVVKLHLKERLPLNQRLASPLLHLLDSTFGADGRLVVLVDVHRGKFWRPTSKSRSMESVLRMQAAAFLVGWDASDPQAGAA